MVTIDLPSYELENLFCEHSSEGHHGHLSITITRHLPGHQAVKHYFLITQVLVTCS